MEIVFCEKCRMRIGLKDLESGAAVKRAETMYCPACAKELKLSAVRMTPAVPSLHGRSTPQSVQRMGAHPESVRRSRRDAPSAAASLPRSSGKVMAVAGSAVIAVFVCAAVLWGSLGSPEPGKSENATPKVSTLPADRTSSAAATDAPVKVGTPAAAKPSPALQTEPARLPLGGLGTPDVSPKDTTQGSGDAKTPTGPPPSTIVAHRLDFAYMADRPSSGEHADTAKPSKLTDGSFSRANTESVQYDGLVNIVADLGEPTEIQKAVACVFHANDFLVDSVALFTSDDQKNWRSVQVVKNSAPAGDVTRPALALGADVNAKARYVKFTIQPAAGSKRVLVGELILAAAPAKPPSLPPVAPPVVSATGAPATGAEPFGPVPAPEGYAFPEKCIYRASFEDGADKWSNVEIVPGGLGESKRCARVIPGRGGDGTRAERWGLTTTMSSHMALRVACFIPATGGASSFYIMCWDKTANDNFRVQFKALERGKWHVLTARLNDWFSWSTKAKPDGHEFNSVSVVTQGGTVIFDDLVFYEE
jgi:hypothetical protein